MRNTVSQELEHISPANENGIIFFWTVSLWIKLAVPVTTKRIGASKIFENVRKICEERLRASSYLSVCPRANNSYPTRRIFMKFVIWEFFFENLPRRLKFHQNQTRIVVIFTWIPICVCWTGSSVSIVTELRVGRSGIESRWGRNFPAFQTGPGAHPASCKMCTGSFPGGKLRPGRAADHSPPF